MKQRKKVLIDCAKTTTPEAIHTAIATQLHFPSYYGANLDALADCLGDTLLEFSVSLVWKDTPASKKNTAIQDIHACLKKAGLKAAKTT